MGRLRRRDLVGVLAWIVAAMTVLGVVVLLVPDFGDDPTVPAVTSVVVSGMLAVTLWFQREDPPAWLGHVGLLWVGFAILSTIAGELDPGAAGFLHVLLVWVGVLSFAFLSRSEAWAHTLLVTALAAVIWGREGTAALEVVVAAVFLLGTVGGVGLVVAILVTRAQTLARRDDLTGAMNRRGVLELLDDRSAVGAGTTTLLVLDLDDFKQVNDAAGHAAGDRLLQEAARRWSLVLPHDATLARVGGDEFLVVLPGADRSTTEQLVQELREETPGRIGVSIGSTTWAADESVETALHRADEALYGAKRKLSRRATDRASVTEDAR